MASPQELPDFSIDETTSARHLTLVLGEDSEVETVDESLRGTLTAEQREFVIEASTAGFRQQSTSSRIARHIIECAQLRPHGNVDL